MQVRWLCFHIYLACIIELSFTLSEPGGMHFRKGSQNSKPTNAEIDNLALPKSNYVDPKLVF